MPLLRAAPDDLFALVSAASRHLGVPADFVEKDFWIVELLRSVSRPTEHATPIFKGGTSLSKAFGLIERFSEDVDILLEIAPADGTPLGRGRVDRILKEICTRVGRDLEIAADSLILRGSTTGVHRDVRYLYPRRTTAELTQEGILLEMGRRGVPLPRQRRPIYSYVREYAISQAGVPESDYEEFAPVHIDVLNAELTLVEKLALVHDLSTRYPASAEPLARSGRHFYDIFRLLSDATTHAMLDSRPGLVATLAEEIDANSRRWEFPYTPRPRHGYAASPAFDVAHSSHEIIVRSYGATAGLIYGKRPSIEECLAVIRGNARVL